MLIQVHVEVVAGLELNPERALFPEHSLSLVTVVRMADGAKVPAISAKNRDVGAHRRGRELDNLIMLQVPGVLGFRLSSAVLLAILAFRSRTSPLLPAAADNNVYCDLL